MNVPEDIKYTREHEWIRIDGKEAVIGVTDYAQDQLGEVVYVELPEEGEEFALGEAFGVVESVKSVNDIFTPISIHITERNDPLTETPETLNDDPYGEGWMVKVRILEPKELDGLLSHTEYEAYIREEIE
jgi:glycine cleavage system H protein